jgi:hypothetical protein
MHLGEFERIWIRMGGSGCIWVSLDVFDAKNFFSEIFVPFFDFWASDCTIFGLLGA